MSKNILAGAIIIIGAAVYLAGPKVGALPAGIAAPSATQISDLEEKVLPTAGVILPARWGDLGKQMITAGVIDSEKFEQLYASRARLSARQGGLSAEMKAMLKGENNGQIKITAENAGVILNLLWALGLGSKNEILEKGPMTDKNYGGAANFASTGGWTLAQGSAMDHYSRHTFFTLTPAQQALVERVSKNIYRPCCGNSTYFPDCNHGMAMLGLLELMASQGVSESDIYKSALAVNAYWFPDTYLTIATYMKNKGIDWQDVSPQEMLGANYSSGQGYAKIVSQVAAPQRQSAGCGI